MGVSGYRGELVGSGAVGIGLLGAGAVGVGVAQALCERGDALERYAGRRLRLAGALVRDVGRARPGFPSGVRLTSEASEIIESDEVAIVVEALGGEHPALEHIEGSLRAGKHVATANKEVIAKHGPEALALASEHRVALRFEAAVGGGIPIIGPVAHDLAANDLTAVNAIINGTTNYILTRMAAGDSYDDALMDARSRGYAEADPSDDVDGVDAAYKLAILSSMAFRGALRDVDVHREGIRGLAPADFRYARELGYAVKLLAASRLEDGGARARVHPAFIPEGHPLAKVDGVYNAVELEGGLVDWAMFQGPGAGSHPTASAVLGDVLSIARSVASGGPPPMYPAPESRLVPLSMAGLETKYYVRLRAQDRPGVMARIAGALGDMGVSLASVIQKGPGEGGEGEAEIVITTHRAREEAVQEAVRRVEGLDVVDGPAVLVRIEEGGA